MDVISKNLDHCAEILAAPYIEKRSTCYRLVFHTHLSTYIDPNTIKEHWTGNYTHLAYKYTFPLGLLSSKTRGKLKLAVLDSNEYGSGLVKHILDHYSIDYIYCDLTDHAQFKKKYAEWRKRENSNNNKKRIVNTSEAALLREIQLGLSVRLPSDFYHEISSNKHELFPLWDHYRERSERINIHPEFALSRIYTFEDNSIDTKIPANFTQDDISFFENSSLDFIVLLRQSRSQPKYGGKILFVAEFDGPHHQEPEQIHKDEKKNKLCKELNIPLLRVGVRGTSLPKRTINDNVVDEPDEVHVFLREIICILQDYEQRKHEIQHKTSIIEQDHMLAQQYRNNPDDLIKIQQLVEREISDSYVPNERREQIVTRRLRRIKSMSREINTGVNKWATYNEERWDCIADGAMLPSEIIDLMKDDSNISHIIQRVIERWYVIDNIEVKREHEAGIRGNLTYRNRVVNSEKQKTITVGPFDVRLIGNKKIAAFYSEVLKEAIKLMLMEKLVESINFNQQSL